MKFTPASSAARMVASACSSEGRLESDIGMPPSPMGNTSASPSLRVWVISDAYPEVRRQRASDARRTQAS